MARPMCKRNRACAAEGVPMNSSAKFRRVLPFVVILGLFSFSASWGADGPTSQTPPIDASLPKVTETATFALG